ncbi:MAG: HAD family hydrolase [Treponema sp.]|nr:HAD family hydrolase [Treponema sp.]
MKFAAIGFDLDGTLYPPYRLNVRLIPFLLKEQRLLRALGRVRIRMREEDLSSEQGREDFYHDQARLMAQILGDPPEAVQEKVERLIYRGWEHHFKHIRLFPHVRETLGALKNRGCKLGLLSDFPPEQKLLNLGLGGLWDAVLSSEWTGSLKPAPAPFLELARRMGSRPDDLLYVGNSVSYDVAGARNAGMKTALIRFKWKGLKKKERIFDPDFVFNDYRQLLNFVTG